VTDLEQLAGRVAELAAEQQRLRAELEESRRERDSYRELYLEMLERCRKLERGLLGQKAERLSPNESQLTLAMMGMLLTDDANVVDGDDDVQEVKPHQRRKPTGRKLLPEHLPRVDVVVLPHEVEREGLNAFEQIGQDKTETIERRPASVVVVRTFKPKFVRKDRDKTDTTVYVAKSHPLPIPRGLAGPGMLADSIVKRWDDHLPLHRLERVYRRDGLELARSTICGWHMALAELAQPVIDAMRQDAFQQPYLCTDATGVLVQAKEKCRTGHFWVLVVPNRHVLFEFTKKHNSDAVDDVLAGYEGYLVADAHAVYDHLYADGSVKEVNCWAHARRYFFKAMSSDPERARVALGLIGALFRIERRLADAPRKKRENIRGSKSKPLVEHFFSWCEAARDQVLDDTPIAKGLRYALNQREGLSRFLHDGRLPLHNNMSELQLRRQAVGRKNWLFVGSEDGAKANTVFVSLLASCRLHKVEPWAYLRDLLCLLPTWPKHRMLEFAPLGWNKTTQLDEVQATLAANPYRAATLLEANAA
jgi:transposase